MVFPAPPSAQAKVVALPKVTGTVVVTAPGTGYVRVHLPRQLILQDWVDPFGPEPDIKVSDPAHFGAIMLVAERPIMLDGLPKHPSATVFTLPTGLAKTRFFSPWAPQVKGAPQHTALPPGDYRLFVVASRPQRITWTLHRSGQPVSVRTLSRPGAAKVATVSSVALPGQMLTSPSLELSSSFRIGRVGELFALMWFHGRRVGDALQTEFCLKKKGSQDVVQELGVPLGYCPGGYNFLPVISRHVIGDVPNLSGPVDENTAGANWVATFDANRKVGTAVLPEVAAKLSMQMSGLVDRAAGIQIWYTLD